MKKHLFLFDIDGTLVNVTGLQIVAHMKGYEDVTGKKLNKKQLVSKFGKPDEQIYTEIFKENKMQAGKKVQDVVDALSTSFVEIMVNEKAVPLPGVVNFLRVLKKENQPCGIVTGNTKQKGEVILKSAGIDDYFSVFGYADGARNRDETVKHTITRAKRKKISFDKVIVIGDTPTDVTAGKANNCITVSVTTGDFSKKELLQTNPDILISSMKEYKKILNALDF